MYDRMAPRLVDHVARCGAAALRRRAGPSVAMSLPLPDLNSQFRARRPSGVGLPQLRPRGAKRHERPVTFADVHGR